jgi:hypothetical protein
MHPYITAGRPLQKCFSRLPSDGAVDGCEVRHSIVIPGEKIDPIRQDEPQHRTTQTTVCTHTLTTTGVLLSTGAKTRRGLGRATHVNIANRTEWETHDGKQETHNIAKITPPPSAYLVAHCCHGPGTSHSAAKLVLDMEKTTCSY